MKLDDNNCDFLFPRLVFPTSLEGGGRRGWQKSWFLCEDPFTRKTDFATETNVGVTHDGVNATEQNSSRAEEHQPEGFARPLREEKDLSCTRSGPISSLQDLLWGKFEARCVSRLGIYFGDCHQAGSHGPSVLSVYRFN